MSNIRCSCHAAPARAWNIFDARRHDSSLLWRWARLVKTASELSWRIALQEKTPFASSTQGRSRRWVKRYVQWGARNNAGRIVPLLSIVPVNSLGTSRTILSYSPVRNSAGAQHSAGILGWQYTSTIGTHTPTVQPRLRW